MCLAVTEQWTGVHIFHFTCIDRRGMQLAFNATLIEMEKQVLLDFRLSRGDGIEFKRRFMQIRSVWRLYSFWRTIRSLKTWKIKEIQSSPCVQSCQILSNYKTIIITLIRFRFKSLIYLRLIEWIRKIALKWWVF